MEKSINFGYDLYLSYAFHGVMEFLGVREQLIVSCLSKQHKNFLIYMSVIVDYKAEMQTHFVGNIKEGDKRLCIDSIKRRIIPEYVKMTCKEDVYTATKKCNSRLYIENMPKEFH